MHFLKTQVFSQQKANIRRLKLSPSKRSYFQLQKTYLPSFNPTNTFFDIFNFVFGGVKCPLENLTFIFNM